MIVYVITFETWGRDSAHFDCCRSQCLTDTFSVSSPGVPSPPIICGKNDGQHSESLYSIHTLFRGMHSLAPLLNLSGTYSDSWNPSLLVSPCNALERGQVWRVTCRRMGILLDLTCKNIWIFSATKYVSLMDWVTFTAKHFSSLHYSR